MKARKCVMCGKKVTSGRKSQFNEDIICNKDGCCLDWVLNNTNVWGYS